MQKGALITPAQRRAALDFQIKNERARATVKRGELQARRLHHLLRDRHLQALNVEGTANPDSTFMGGGSRDSEARREPQSELRRESADLTLLWRNGPWV